MGVCMSPDSLVKAAANCLHLWATELLLHASFCSFVGAEQWQAASFWLGTAGSELAACSLTVTSLFQTLTTGSLSIYGRAPLSPDCQVYPAFLHCVCLCVCVWDRERYSRFYLTRQTDLAISSHVCRSFVVTHLSTHSSHTVVNGWIMRLAALGLRQKEPPYPPCPIIYYFYSMMLDLILLFLHLIVIQPCSYQVGLKNWLNSLWHRITKVQKTFCTFVSLVH